jgi:SagB-type dehydrogenase family enzyme
MSGIGKEFIEKTKHRYLDQSDQMKGFPPPSLELNHSVIRDTVDHENNDQKVIDSGIIGLPDPKTVPIDNVATHEAIDKRRSIRQYSSEPLSVGELSFLLWCTQGVKEVAQNYYTLRTVPSAGARHALETYLLVNNVTNLQSGLYRFLPIEHSIVREAFDSDLSERIGEACYSQNFINSSAVTFIWTAVVYRMKWRYGERGYRYLLLDAGHVCQNLYLAAKSVKCGVCAVAAYSDDDMNAILNIDGVEQFVIYLAAVGKKAP